MTRLESMDQHGPILLLQEVGPHFHHQVGSNTEEVSVECRMMELAEGDAIRDPRLSLRMLVRENVGRLEKFFVSQATDGAAASIGGKDAVPEAPLVEPLLSGGGDVDTPTRGQGVRHGLWLGGSEDLLFIERHREGEVLGIVSYHEGRPFGDISPAAP